MDSNHTKQIQSDEGLRKVTLEFIADFANFENSSKAEYINISVPTPICFGQPSASFEYCFLGYKFVSGKPLEALPSILTTKYSST